MTEKKIDLSNVKVGDKLWTTHDGECFAEKIRESSAGAKISAANIDYDLSGKEYAADKFPTCFHSREEFLDFHNIAPVRMTEKELKRKYETIEDVNNSFDIMRAGFLLSGGQIIEEPKNLPCICGSIPQMFDIGNDDSKKVLECKNTNCMLCNIPISREVWNDPKKRGGK